MSTNDLNLVPTKCRKFAAGDKLASGYCLKKPLPASLPGVAWLASDPDLQKDLALHFLPESVVKDPGAMEELKREFHKNRQLVHPRILRYFDLIEEEEWVALVMEVAGGESLRHLLDRKKFFECREVKDWLGEICSTVGDAHKGDLLHRNLSLDNIRIKANGELVVANFGVSRVISDSLARTAQKDSKDRKVSKPTRADDIYAIGSLLYQLLTGTPPFSNDENPENRNGSFVPVSERRKQVGIKGERILPEWEKTIALCLEKNANLRPKTAIEIAMRLGGQRPVTEVGKSELPGGTVRLSGAAGPARLAVRSTVKPGGAAGFERGESGGESAEASSEAPAPDSPNKSQAAFSKSGGRQYPTTVFMPMDRPLTQSGMPIGLGPVVKFLGICLVLAGIAAGAYFFFAGRSSKPPKPLIAASSPVEEKEVVPEPAKVQEPSPTPVTASQAVQATPVPTPPEPPKAPETPRMKILVEPQNIPEEQSKVVRAAKKIPSILEETRAALASTEKLRQDKTVLQEKALAELKDAQAVAEKANAELLLKQAAAGDAAKNLADLAHDAEEKARAIKDAQAESARFQAVAAQIASLKMERAVETEVPASPEAAQSVAPELPADAPEPSQIPAPTTSSAPSLNTPKSNGGSQETVNSLGMRFVPVGDVKFSIWLTRVQDFEAFATATGAKSQAWKQPGFAQGPTHPVVNVSWKEASAFCRWLTLKEHKEGTLPANLVYRLPTDAEWSQAVGLPFEKGRSAASRDMDVPGVYPWGTEWPPAPGTGNFTGEETGSDAAIKGYNDGFAWTSPVGSFPPNRYGLYDMAGNAWQWCMDYWNEEQKARVLRGSSWCNSALNYSLLSSCRFHAAPDSIADNYSFRCVIAPEGYQ